MTFHARLTELLEKATDGKWQYYWRATDDKPDCGVFSEKSPGQAYSVCRSPQYQKKAQWESDAALICILVNHAEAIRDLVVAVDELEYAGRELVWNCQAMRDAVRKATEALAKLEEA